MQRLFLQCDGGSIVNPLILAMFWWICCQCYHVSNAFSDCPFGVAAFLGSWLGLQVSPRVWMGMEHQFPYFLYFCLSNFVIQQCFYGMRSLCQGCTIHSCNFGFGMGFHELLCGNVTCKLIVSSCNFIRDSPVFKYFLPDLQRVLGVAPSILVSLDSAWVSIGFCGNATYIPLVFS